MDYSQNQEQHELRLQNRQDLMITGVLKVYEFYENHVKLKTNQGFLEIKGENLFVDKIDLEKGELKINGQVSELRYSESGAENTKAWLKKLFG